MKTAMGKLYDKMPKIIQWIYKREFIESLTDEKIQRQNDFRDGMSEEFRIIKSVANKENQNK